MSIRFLKQRRIWFAPEFALAVSPYHAFFDTRVANFASFRFYFHVILNKRKLTHEWRNTNPPPYLSPFLPSPLHPSLTPSLSSSFSLSLESHFHSAKPLATVRDIVVCRLVYHHWFKWTFLLFQSLIESSIFALERRMGLCNDLLLNTPSTKTFS